MSQMDRLKGLRGGVIYSAARVTPSTARTWAVDLGAGRPGGHPRYDVSDVFALLLMVDLTTGKGMAAGYASLIVNALRPKIGQIIEDVLAENAEIGGWLWEDGPFAVVSGRPSADRVESWLQVVDAADVGKTILSRASGSTPVVIALRRLINKAVLNLTLVLAGDIDEGPDA